MRRAFRLGAVVGAMFIGSTSAFSHAADVELNTDETCFGTIGATVTVTIDLRNATANVVGGQFFLRYDTSALQFVSAVPGDAPFTVEVYEAVPGDGGADTIDYAVSTPSGDPGTMADLTMAVLTFTTLDESCASPVLLTFRSHDPPTRLSNEVGDEVAATFYDLGGVSIDTTDPQIMCPSNVSVEVGDSTDPADTGMASGSDTCDTDPQIDYSDSSAAGVCPVVSTITRTWAITDHCDHSADCVQTITVEDADSDGDGTANCADGCPNDPGKISPGLCGCGVSDADADLDTIPDCNDVCPGQDDRIDENNDNIPDCTIIEPVPAASTWGIVVLGLILLIGSKLGFRRRLA